MQMPKSLLPGAILALLAVLFGFGLGGVFGAAEHTVKGTLRSSADAVMDSVYKGDKAKSDRVVSKSWSYLKRAHLHGGAIGAVALAVILFLAAIGQGRLLGTASSLALGAGALIYGVFWMLAALNAPSLGSTGAAKESLEWLAIPGAGLCILGTLGALLSALLAWLRPSPE